MPQSVREPLLDSQIAHLHCFLPIVILLDCEDGLLDLAKYKVAVTIISLKTALEPGVSPDRSLSYV